LRRKKVLLFSTFSTPFIENDRLLISHFADVKYICSSGISAIFRLLFYPVFSDSSIAWFASTYSAIMVFISRLFHKTSIVLVGGADVYTDQHWNYGLLISGWKKVLVRYALKKATHVLPTSNFLANRSLDLLDGGQENISVLYPGLDPEYWKPNRKKESSVLTVAHCPNEDRFYIKGIDILFEAARSLTEVSFTVIGIDSQIIINLNIEIPPNIDVIKYTPHDELLQYYQRAWVYCQPSRIESLSVTVGEAMMCGSIPVVTRVGGMPEVVEDVGYIIPAEDSKALSNAITKALKHQTNDKKPREVATKVFSISTRETILRKLLSQ